MTEPAARQGPFTVSDLLPLSGLQHLAFCERQCALIHVERLWAENRLTAEGRVLHERVHAPGDESRGRTRIVRDLALRSVRLGLAGRADVVEFRRLEPHDVAGAIVARWNGRWRPYPIEYKRGRPKRDDCDRVQLCAQALCLEEMFAVVVPEGALFYGRTRRRESVPFDDALRARTKEHVVRFRQIVSSGTTPIVGRMPKCRSCSLADLCLPPRGGMHRAVDEYLARGVGEFDA